MDAVGGVQCNG